MFTSAASCSMLSSDFHCFNSSKKETTKPIFLVRSYIHLRMSFEGFLFGFCLIKALVAGPLVPLCFRFQMTVVHGFQSQGRLANQTQSPTGMG